MAENDTLLAHMVLELTPQVEVAATRALAFILNKSDAALEGLNQMVAATIHAEIEPVKEVRVEEHYTEGQGAGRLDFVGRDRNGEKRIIGESKFWAKLLEGQGSSYMTQLDSGNAVLLFVVPDARIDYLWWEVRRDVVGTDLEKKLKVLETGTRTKCASLDGTDRYLMMVSWRDLLQRLHDGSYGDPEVQSEIRQLRGLADLMDRRAFLPLSNDELGQHSIRRLHQFQGLGMDAIETGRQEQWITNVSNYTSRWPGGYGRAFQLGGAKAWFGLNGDLWSSKGDTPMWLILEDVSLSQVPNEMQDKYRFLPNGARFDIPVYLKTSVDYDVVLADVVSQLREIADAVKITAPDFPD